MLDEEKVKLIKMYCESVILTSNVFVVLCHVFDVLLMKWKQKKYHNDGIILKSYRKIIERSKISSTKIKDFSLDTGTTIKSCRVKLVL